jgi:hypothetical protein
LKEEASLASLSVKTLAGTWPTIEQLILASQAYLTAGAGKSAVDHPQEKLRQAWLNPDFQLPLRLQSGGIVSRPEKTARLLVLRRHTDKKQVRLHLFRPDIRSLIDYRFTAGHSQLLIY